MARSWLWRSASSWARVVLTCCLFALLIPGPGSYASEQTDLLESLKQRLLTINVLVGNLEAELATSKALSAESEKQVQELLLELEALRMFSADSQAKVKELRASVEALEQKLTLLSKIWLDSNNNWKAIADAERVRSRRTRLWAWIVGGICLGAGIGIGALLR
jgi:hypothetical protein